MNIVTALAIVIGALGAVATYLFLGPLGGAGLQIWAAFIAWASFFHCGGNEKALKDSVIANIWGSLWATIALILVTSISLGSLPVTAAVWVGITVAIMIAGAHIPVFGAIPAQVYGYAATAGYALLGTKLDTLTTPSLANPFVVVSLSMIIGGIFGLISGKIAGALAK